MGIENIEALQPDPDEVPEVVKKTEEEMAAEFAANEAHQVDENPLDHIGEEMPDPWSDEKQTDWPNCSDVTAPVEAPKEES